MIHFFFFPLLRPRYNGGEVLLLERTVTKKKKVSDTNWIYRSEGATGSMNKRIQKVSSERVTKCKWPSCCVVKNGATKVCVSVKCTWSTLMLRVWMLLPLLLLVWRWKKIRSMWSCKSPLTKQLAVCTVLDKYITANKVQIVKRLAHGNTICVSMCVYVCVHGSDFYSHKPM